MQKFEFVKIKAALIEHGFEEFTNRDSAAYAGSESYEDEKPIIKRGKTTDIIFDKLGICIVGEDTEYLFEFDKSL